MGAPLTWSVIIPTRDSAAVITRCLDQFAAWRPLPELIVVDGGSTDGTRELLAQHPSQPYVIVSPHGYALQCRLGVKEAQGSAFLILPPEFRLPADAYSRLFKALADGEIGGGFFQAPAPEAGPLPLPSLLRRGWTGLTRLPSTRQAVFCRRGAYELAQGVPDHPDRPLYAFALALKRTGPLAILPPVTLDPALEDAAAFSWQALREDAVLLMRYHLGLAPRDAAPLSPETGEVPATEHVEALGLFQEPVAIVVPGTGLPQEPEPVQVNGDETEEATSNGSPAEQTLADVIAATLPVSAEEASPPEAPALPEFLQRALEQQLELEAGPAPETLQVETLEFAPPTVSKRITARPDESAILFTPLIVDPVVHTPARTTWWGKISDGIHRLLFMEPPTVSGAMPPPPDHLPPPLLPQSPPARAEGATSAIPPQELFEPLPPPPDPPQGGGLPLYPHELFTPAPGHDAAADWTPDPSRHLTAAELAEVRQALSDIGPPRPPGRVIEVAIPPPSEGKRSGE